VVWYIFFFIFVCLCFICAIRIIFNQLPLPANFTVNMIHITHGLGRVLISKPDVNCTYKT
jgi:uncharacterized MnhB-related membrane protein